MAWAFIIMYATARDGDLLLRFINDAAEVMWITMTGEKDCVYQWRAVDRLDRLPEGEHVIWHSASGPLNIPSGSPKVPDSIVADPYAGWSQILDHPGASRPWFGSNPAPIFLSLHYSGREAAQSVGRSDFAWAGDHFSGIGKPAAPEAKRWWQSLRTFVRKNAEAQSWPPGSTSRVKAYVFPEALSRVADGASLDVNP